MYNRYRSFLGVFAKIRNATISFVVSVRPSAWNNSTSTGQIFIKFGISVFFENLSRKFKFSYNLIRIKGTLHKDLCPFIYRCILLKIRNASGGGRRENQNTPCIIITFVPIIDPFMRWCEQMSYSQTGHR
jgi:hypothetical protein